jgi:hypothetical protein
MNKIKYLILGIDLLLGKVFFYSQSRFSNILKDTAYSKFHRLKKSFNIIKGNTSSSMPKLNHKALKTPSRSNSSAMYSSGQSFEEMPEIFHEIISKHASEITRYLGKGYLYERCIAFRNFNMPNDLMNYDVYSNVWHQDSHDGNRLLKIFLLPHDVKVSDGPFHYLEEVAVKKHWEILRERYDFEKMKEIPQFEEENILTGIKGDYLILDTSRFMHRASIPDKYRDILQITLYPSWRKTNHRSTYSPLF